MEHRRGGPMRVDMYRVCGDHHHCHLVTSTHALQINTLHTPPPPPRHHTVVLVVVMVAGEHTDLRTCSSASLMPKA